MEITVGCPDCGADQPWDEVEPSVSDWHAGGTGIRRCSACGRWCGLNDWNWDPPWGLGCLGFEFWGWWPLTDAFIAEVAGLLEHRVAVPYGRI